MQNRHKESTTSSNYRFCKLCMTTSQFFIWLHFGEQYILQVMYDDLTVLYMVVTLWRAAVHFNAKLRKILNGRSLTLRLLT